MLNVLLSLIRSVEFAHLTLSSRTVKPQPRIFTAEEIDRLLEREGLAKAKHPEDEPAAVAAAAAASTDFTAAQAAGSMSESTRIPEGAGSGTGQGSEAGGGEAMHVD